MGDSVLTRMRRSIVQGDWMLGEKISEARVAASLGTSKTPVREALVQLKHEGLVEIRPQAGTFVFTLAPGELNQICEMRWVLEAAALRRVFEIDARAELVKRLKAVFADMQAAWTQNDVSCYLSLDGAFHQAICEVCGSPYILQSYNLIAGKVAALRTHLGIDPHHLEKSFAEHERLVDLVATADLELVLALLASHIARKEGSYWEHLDQTPAGGILPRQE
ncbi:GntR family transcriptional regulator [Algihabitans albus]|uniref:GntR family transcriptional regulator n=1 Tax=Algihabitans albus TaxID=2164067 RepID=UPI0013C33EDE|nr:GntR family transcriptional regulator [Algihabitans albus]